MNRLVDQFGRIHEYLRISVTDRCNLRCRYCMPIQGIELRAKEELLTFDEHLRLAEIFLDFGIRKIRLTGGEPLVRKDIEYLCERLASDPRLQTLAISTNGIMLEEKANALKKAGVRQVNISLDTLRADRFSRITLRTGLTAVLRGIEYALRTGFQSVKINTVVMKGFNDDELLDFVEFARTHALNLRFIEYMPFLGNGWSDVKFVPYRTMRGIIEAKYSLRPILTSDPVHGPAKEFRVAGTDAVIGFITTMSDHVCQGCNRLRLTADGKLRTCLFAHDAVDLRSLIRSGKSDEDIGEAIQAGVRSKWEKHPDANELVALPGRAMTAIGG